MITGCNHPGIVNTVEYVNESYERDETYAVLGGFHLMKPGADRVKSVIEKFRDMNVQKSIPAIALDARQYIEY